MVSKTFFVIAALCFCQAIARPGGESEDNVQKLTTAFETFTTEIGKVFDIKETKESKQIADNLKENANELAKGLTGILNSLNTEVKSHSGDVNNAVDALKAKVSEAVKKIQEDHPVEAAKAHEYQEQFKNTYNDVITKAKEAAAAIAKDTSGVQEDLHKFTDNIIKEVKTNLQKVNEDLKKSLDEHKKEHKH